MDGSSFDRLSVSVHRLRGQATRRNALRLLAGGSAAALASAVVPDADAKKKHKNKKYKKCRNRSYGGSCRNNKDCCNGKCRYGICWYNGGGGGKGGCGGVRCPNGWTCRKQGPAHICSPYNYPNYCGNNTYWGNDYKCCGGNYGGFACPWGECCGIATCCQSGWKCCGGSTCVPNGWDCNDFFRGAEIGGESVPTMEPTPPDANDSFVFDPDSAE
ncbi:MAG: hypothetical protein KC442_21425 [Thermomicrobiales bacterium]|nr:hypothetical protein [Thermomicrobiales bacterium]